MGISLLWQKTSKSNQALEDLVTQCFMTEPLKKIMTEEGWNAFVASVAWKGNRLIIPREQAAIITALGPLDFQKWLAESITSYQPVARPLSGHLYEFIIHKDGANVDKLQKQMDNGSFVFKYAKEMMEKKEFVIGPIEDVVIRVYRADVLGVSGWSEAKFFGSKGWKHLKGFNLAECLPDDAPYIRRAHDKQKPGEWIRVAHNPILALGGSVVFSVEHRSSDIEVEFCLNGNSVTRTDLSADDLLAVRVAS